MKPSALLGLRTVVYQVSDIERAKEWYRAALGKPPYFDEPFYVGFNVGGFELGLHPAAPGAPTGAGGAVAYWGVENMQTAWERLLALGATSVSAPSDVGGGIQVATLADPFGNALGIIENPHFPNDAD
jgi:predicted enzyme related to lactoylglutathione lyase